MTKRELLELLAPFDDDQYVYIRLHSDDYPDGCQVMIRGVEVTQPWYGDQLDTPSLIALVAHERNKELGPFVHPNDEIGKRTPIQWDDDSSDPWATKPVEG